MRSWGSASLWREANGIARASHVRDKLVALVGYAETVRGMTHLAADRCRVDPLTGVAFPDPMTTNIAKWTFARDFYKAAEHLVDIAGGLLVTGPAGQDWRSDEISPTSRSTSSGPHPLPSDWPFSTWRATCSPGSTPATRASSRCTPRVPRSREADDLPLVRPDRCGRLRQEPGRAVTAGESTDCGHEPAARLPPGPPATRMRHRLPARTRSRAACSSPRTHGGSTPSVRTAPSVDKERDVAVVEAPDGRVAGCLFVIGEPPS